MNYETIEPEDVKAGDLVKVRGYGEALKSRASVYDHGLALHQVNGVYPTIISVTRADSGETQFDVLSIVEARRKVEKPKAGEWSCDVRPRYVEDAACIMHTGPHSERCKVYRSTGWSKDERETVRAEREFKPGDLVNFRVPCRIGQDGLLRVEGIPISFPEPAASFHDYLTHIERRKS